MLKTALKVLIVFTVFTVQNSCIGQISTINGVPDNSSPNFGPASSASSFPNAFSSAGATSGSLGQPNLNYPPSNTFSLAADSTSASGASSQASTIPPSLDTFVTTFTNAIQSSPILVDAFDLSQTSPKSFADFLSHAIHTHSISRGISDPRDIATDATQHISESFKVITYPMLVRINANAMGKHLLAEGILNDMNAASLGLAFANEMETSSKQTVDKSFQESKFQALVNGYAGFLKSQGLYTREQLPVAGKHFGNEIRHFGAQIQ